MVTYGKKKRFILPSFSVFKDSMHTHKAGKDKKTSDTSNQALLSSISNPILTSKDGRHIPFQYDDSIEELASMLLDESDTDELNIKSVELPTKPDSVQVVPGRSIVANEKEKALPRASRPHDEDDNHSTSTSLGITSSPSQMLQFNGDGTNPSLPSKQIFHARRISGPPLPRRSSRRKSSRPHIDHLKYINTNGIYSGGYPQHGENNGSPSGVNGAEINKKIENLFTVTQALKVAKATQTYTPAERVTDVPFISAKKRRLKDNRVLVKVKTAINDRFTSHRHDSLREEHLLDPLQIQVTESGADDSLIYHHEIMVNEGANLENKEKVQKVLGHGNHMTKPVPDNGRYLWNNKSFEVSFSDRLSMIDIPHTPTNHHVYSDHHEYVPNVPHMLGFEYRSICRIQQEPFHSRQGSNSSSIGTSESSELPSRRQTPKNQLRHTRKTSNLIYDADCDALFSSSPLGSSTPRIRLEPNEDDGKRKLRSVSANLPSVFDSVMDIDNEPARLAFASSQVQNRIKKHPSPSKKELEELDSALKKYDDFSRGFKHPQKMNANISDSSLAATTILGEGNRNVAVKSRKTHGRGIREKPHEFGLLPSADSMPKIPFAKSCKGFPTRIESRSLHKDTRSQLEPAAIMDIDELQWDDSAYNIGRKRT